MEIKTYGGAYPIPSSNNLCLTHNRLSDVLLDFVPFVQLEKREKQPWRSVTFSKVAG